MIPDYFTEEQVTALNRNPQFRQYGAECPVCLDTGKFKFMGEEFDCLDDDYGHVTLRLAKLYWLHNIDIQYQQLVWDQFPHADVKSRVDMYLEGYRRLRLQGIGMTFFSPRLGTGKSWAATQILKNCVKQGYDGWFASFFDVKSYFEISDKEERDYKINRVREAEILVLDEVKKPVSEAQKNFYEDKLEDLIRPRTNANFPTIITTNMMPEEIEQYYPRIFSLVTAKNLWIEMPQDAIDARADGNVLARHLELQANGETWPIQ